MACTLAMRWSIDPGQLLATQVTDGAIVTGVFDPAHVVGAGTLGPLIVYGPPLHGNPSSPGDLVEVWVLRNGQVLNTGISCALPNQGNTTTATAQRCQSTSSFAVGDGDDIIATMTVNPNEEVWAMSFYLVKN